MGTFLFTLFVFPSPSPRPTPASTVDLTPWSCLLLFFPRKHKDCVSYSSESLEPSTALGTSVLDKPLMNEYTFLPHGGASLFLRVEGVARESIILPMALDAKPLRRTASALPNSGHDILELR